MWRHVVTVVLGVAMAGLLFLGWPSQWGGTTTYVVVRGDSMLPNYHTGDVLIAREASMYEIGDVLVYAVPEEYTGAGTLIMHRLVGFRDDGRYIIQGDNRDTPDQFDIRFDDVRGVQRAHLPKVGLLMGLLSQVWFVALLVGLFVILQLWPENDEDEHKMTDRKHIDGVQPHSAGETGSMFATDEVGGESINDVELVSPDDLEPVAPTQAADGSAESVEPVEPVVVTSSPRRSRVRARVVVDGDSVVRFAWPTLSADDAQQRCADASNLVGIRFGTVVAVALANADAAPSDGSHTTVIVAPHPQTMRELLHDHVGQFNGELTVVVVTDDASVRADALEQGASTLSAAQWLDFVDS